MEMKNVRRQIVALTFTAVIVVAMGQGCPGLVRYTSCLNFVHKDKQLPGFNDPCCVTIRATRESCLCDIARNNANRGIDLEKAMTLPKACGLTVLPNTYCGNLKVPN